MLASSASRRILALVLPQLAIDRLARRQSGSTRSVRSDEAAAVAVVARLGNAWRLTAVNDEAMRQGLAPGMPLADARAVHPALQVVEADPDADARLLAALADWCDRFTPFIALDPPDGLVLDISGCAHLFGGEEALLGDIPRRLARQGLRPRVAIAGTRLAARALSRFAGGGLVAPGDEARALGPLPVIALGLPAETAKALRRAGLDTIADLAGRARAPLTARFGRDVLDALDAALGRLDEPLSPRRPPPSFAVAQTFAAPLTDQAGILAVLSGLALDLGARLERAGEGARRLEAAFFRTDGALARIVVEAGLPVRDPGAITRLFRERLDALADPLDPGFGFDLIRLAALAVTPLRPTADRLDGGERDRRAFSELIDRLDGGERDRRALSELIDRLGARFGIRRVLRFMSQDTHVPEAAAITLPAAAAGPIPAPPHRPLPPGEPPMRPLRLFDPPERIEALAMVPDGPPVRFRWRRALHGVVKAEGPERIAMEWWRLDGKPLTRDYFRVEDDSGRRFWLYRDGLYGREVEQPRWFLHGLFA